MEATKKPVYTLHEEHKEWMSNLSFYEDEIKVMRNRIAEVCAKNNNKEILALVDHFENQMKVQKNNIDELKHSVKQEEGLIEKEIKNNSVAIDHRKLAENVELVNQIKSFENHFNDLRKELNAFVAKWI